ncbi:MAG: hypothetical protein QOJ11_120 [Frankiales bacterium]|jgi:hypothetical protein|nr:hypothetical protein [Frankiales bacterium]
MPLVAREERGHPMELRVLLVVGDGAPSDIDTTVADAVAEIAQRTGIHVTVTTAQDGVCARREELARYHLVHVIGSPTFAMLELGRSSIPLVVTPNRRQRRTHPVARRRPVMRPWWLVHGRSNAVALVNDGVATSSHVLPLPLLPYLDVHPAEWASLRARSRVELGVSPGQTVVVGFGPTSERLCHAMAQLSRSVRHDVLPVWVASGPSTGAAYDAPHRGLPRQTHVVGETVGRRLLPAMDVLVTAGSSFAARTPAVDAANAGIPIISTPGDVAADFVDLAEGGSLLVTCDADHLIDAVDDALQEAARGRTRRLRLSEVADGDAAIATTERCYSRALHRPLSGTTTLLRGA